MKILNFAILLVLLAACQAAPATDPIHAPALTGTALPATPANTSAPTRTNTVQPTRTSTPEPTATPIVLPDTPTPTLESAAFEMPAAFSPFENQFPLAAIDRTGGYLLRCAFNSAEIVYDLVAIDPFEIRSWVKCYFPTPDGRIDFVSFPWLVVNMDNRSYYISTGIEQGGRLPNPRMCSPDFDVCGFTVVALEKTIPAHIGVLSGTEKPKIYVIGLGFGYPYDSADLSQDFMHALIENSTSAEALDEFARTGNASLLPSAGQVERFLPAYDYYYDVFK